MFLRELYRWKSITAFEKIIPYSKNGRYTQRKNLCLSFNTPSKHTLHSFSVHSYQMQYIIPLWQVPISDNVARRDTKSIQDCRACPLFPSKLLSRDAVYVGRQNHCEYNAEELHAMQIEAPRRFYKRAVFLVLRLAWVAGVFSTEWYWRACDILFWFALNLSDM